MNKEDTKRLTYLTDEVARLMSEKANIDCQIKEACQHGKDKLGLNVKTIRKLAKDKNMSGLDRLAQQQLEEELDDCRAALGLLVDTPLGQSALDQATVGGNA